MRLIGSLLVVLLVAGPAQAALTERDLAEVKIAPPADARLPGSLVFRDVDGRTMTMGAAISGRPALLIPVDYTCRSICGPTLAIAAVALAGTGLRPGRDYHLLLIGIDPKDSDGEARAFAEARIGDPAISASTRIGTGDAQTVEAVMTALGYRAVYDADNDQFAHPSAVVTLTPEARVSRVLSGLALDPHDLRLALVEAAGGQIGGLTDRLSLLCYGFDPVHGIYTPAIRRILQSAGAATVGSLVVGLILLHRRSRHARRSREGAP